MELTRRQAVLNVGGPQPAHGLLAEERQQQTLTGGALVNQAAGALARWIR